MRGGEEEEGEVMECGPSVYPSIPGEVDLLLLLLLQPLIQGEVHASASSVTAMNG